MEDKTLKEDWPPSFLSKTGCFLEEERHRFDSGLTEVLVDFFKEEGGSVCDLGCGCHGYYALELIKNGIDCSCFDGNPNTPRLTDNVCGVRDLAEDFDDMHDWLLCLEVGEHIPKKYQDTFINNLHKNNKKGIILSWAVIGQTDSVEHVNEQNNDYIKGIFNNLGYSNDLSLENSLRAKARLKWFRNTVMVFKK